MLLQEPFQESAPRESTAKRSWSGIQEVCWSLGKKIKPGLDFVQAQGDSLDIFV